MEEWPEFTDDLDFLDAHDVVVISEQQIPVEESQVPTIPVWCERAICDVAIKLIIDGFKARLAEDNPPE